MLMEAAGLPVLAFLVMPEPTTWRLSAFNR
jgi:hypothetical protein